MAQKFLINMGGPVIVDDAGDQKWCERLQMSLADNLAIRSSWNISRRLRRLFAGTVQATQARPRRIPSCHFASPLCHQPLAPHPVPSSKATIACSKASTFPPPSISQTNAAASPLQTKTTALLHIMTRVSVYISALVAFAAATIMILTSIWLPNWVTYSVTTATGETVEKHIGLHKSCSTLDDPHCRDFPPKDLCENGERYFCSMWRTVGFMASFSTLLCLAGLVTFAVIMGGGKYKRETGWPFVGAMLTLVSVVEFVTISIVAYLYDNDDQFTIPGWNLDVSFYLSTVSAAICLLTAAGISLSAYLLPPEEGYDFLADPLDA